MCGIVGIFNNRNSEELAKEAITILKYRGNDATGFHTTKNGVLAHRLHSIVGYVEQPIKGKGVLVSNCEIYNWKELKKRYKLNAKNDSELLLRLLDKKGIVALEELDGVYAFAYLLEKKLILARDIIGLKPIWYSHADGFSFASEKKALEKVGLIDINELNPRKILIYHIEKNELEFIERGFFKIIPEIRQTKEDIIKDLNSLITKSIEKRIPARKFGLLFSGGIDSALLASKLKKIGCNFMCYTAVLDEPSFKEPEDLLYAKKVAAELRLRLKIVKIKLKDVEKHLKLIVPLIEDSNVVKVGVALTFYSACQQAKKDGCKVIFSGLGSEEIFAGYERHKGANNINKECVSGLLKMYERDTYRDDVVSMYNGLELRTPFLDLNLVKYALRIPAKYKIKGEMSKAILREVALMSGMKKEFALRKKRAAQYGSNFHKAIKKLSKGHDGISDYLRQFYASHNVCLGALVSSGKDSIYATYVMQKQNYKIGCLIALKSKNPDSYMFHTPTVDLVKLQAKSMGVPLVEQETTGKKEEELQDLETALKKAKEIYKIRGVVTGALYSSYQRDRIEKIADKLGLKIFAPLWHIDQGTEIREILDNNFKFILTKVACEGLDKSFLNKIVDNNFLNRFTELNKEYKINIAGEGGEYETLVLDCPIFNKKLELIDHEIKEEDKNSCYMIIKKIKLTQK